VNSIYQTVIRFAAKHPNSNLIVEFQHNVDCRFEVEKFNIWRAYFRENVRENVINIRFVCLVIMKKYSLFNYEPTI